MTPIRLLLPLIVALIAVVPASCAQETASSENAIQDAVAESLPSWWRIIQFEVTQQASPQDQTSPDEAPEPTGKAPGVTATGNGPHDGAAGKPGALVPGASVATRFAATLELTARIYEPLYSLDGTAIVQPIMDDGDRIEVTGYVLSEDDMVFADPGIIHLDQEGLLGLGRPSDEFEYPTVILGTEEADEFLASRDAARVEGTMRKLMGDTGDEL